jgi:Outer membrane receptor for Fe3+-dicitrate
MIFCHMLSAGFRRPRPFLAAMLLPFLCDPLGADLAASDTEPTPFAEDAVSAGEPPHILDPLEVTGLLPDQLALTPGAGSVLLAEELDRLRPANLHQATTFVPGLRAIDDDAAGRRIGIGLRAAPARRSRKVLLLEDNVPVNGATYIDPSTHHTPPLDRLERVEVLRGAGHLRHAPLNNHGVVNFRNVRPTSTPETLVRVAGGELDTARFHARHSRREGPFGIVLAYTTERSDGSFDIERMRYHDFHFATEWQAGPDDQLAFSVTHFRERSRYDESNLTPAEYAAAPRRKAGRFGQEYNAFALDLWRTQLTHVHQTASGLAFETTLHAANLNRPRVTVDGGESPVSALPDLAPDDPFDPAAGTGHMLGRLRRYRTFGVETLLASSPSSPAPERDLSDLPQATGADPANDRSWRVGLGFDRQFLDDRRSTGAEGEILTTSSPGPITRHVAYQATAAAVFAEETRRFGPWSVSVGARAEYYTQSRFRRSLPADPGPHDPRESDSHTLFLPSASLLHDGLRDTEFFANIGRGYMPAIARTAESFPLRPEIGLNSQLGARTRALPLFDLEIAVFANRFSDTIVHAPYTRDDQNVFLNSADSRAYGIDLALRLRSTAEIRPVVELAYNYTRARFSGGLADGNDVPEVPRQTAALTLGVERASRWHASVTLSHLGSFFTDPANTRSLTLADEAGAILGPGDEFEVREPVVLGRVPSHTLLSARVSVNSRDGALTFWAQARNLTDRLYIADLENGVRPGPPRTVLAGLDLRF